MSSEKLNYENFVSNVLGGSYKDLRSYVTITSTMKEIVDDSEVIGFYPKNLFLDNKTLEAYVFKSDKILIFTENDEGVYLKTFSSSNINGIQYYRSKDEGHPTLKLTIKLSDEEVIVLDPEKDTISSNNWVDKFTKLLMDIVKLLS